MITYDEAQKERKKDLHDAWMEGRKKAENGEPRKTDYSEPELIEAYADGYDSVEQDA